MKSIRRILIFSLVITLPVSTLFSIWLYRSFELYLKHDQVNTLALNKGERLYDVGVIQYLSLKDDIYSILGFSGKADYKLYIKPQLLTELDSQILLNNKAKKKSILFDKNKHFTGKAKYRGDNYYHWLYPQKSWRFDTSKDNLYNGVRKNNFIIPKGHELLNNHLPYKLAKELDLLAPDSQLVTMSINNKFDGPKLMAEQIDEGFLRKNSRMPNDIYKGDNMGSKRIIGIKTDLFNVPSIWEKAAYNNHYDKDNLHPLETLLDGLGDDKIVLLDITQMAKFMAFIDMTNSYHYDKLHNWILYYDAYYERMYPIVWDPHGWWHSDDRKKKTNIVTSKLLDALYRDYRFLFKKYEIMYDFYSEKIESFDSVVNKELENARRIIKDVGYTMRIGQRHVINKTDSLNEVDKFEKRVHERLGLVKEYFLGKAKPADYKYAETATGIRLSINGSKLVSKIIIKTNLTDSEVNVNVKYSANGKMLNKIIGSGLKLINGNLVIHQKLLANAVIAGNMQFDEATYDFIVSDIKPGDITGVDLVFSNLQKEKLSIKKVARVQQKEFNGLSHVIDVTPKRDLSRWHGKMVFNGYTEINNNIVIEKGTQVVFGENATVKVFGNVMAKGTTDEPIIFKAANNNKPWKSFVLKDANANNSKFENCIFENGSGDKGKLHEYTAMLSIHNVKNVKFDKCTFMNSHVTDDMIHVVYSDVVFKETKFINSLSDALDADISNIVVDNCEFINSGNDSIDLMTSNAVVVNSKFMESKDKGISIGEGSNLLAINNYLDANEIGMQSKDTSKAYIYNSTFVNNKIAIDAYHKNWRYADGGNIFIDTSKFDDNDVVATVGKKSKVVINDSVLDEIKSFNKKDIEKNKIIISKDGPIKSDLKGSVFQPYYSLIKPKMIGSYE